MQEDEDKETQYRRGLAAAFRNGDKEAVADFKANLLKLGVEVERWKKKERPREATADSASKEGGKKKKKKEKRAKRKRAKPLPNKS